MALDSLKNRSLKIVPFERQGFISDITVKYFVSYAYLDMSDKISILGDILRFQTIFLMKRIF